jgi:hypothetical protein
MLPDDASDIYRERSQNLKSLGWCHLPMARARTNGQTMPLEKALPPNVGGGKSSRGDSISDGQVPRLGAEHHTRDGNSVLAQQVQPCDELALRVGGEHSGDAKRANAVQRAVSRAGRGLEEIRQLTSPPVDAAREEAALVWRAARVEVVEGQTHISRAQVELGHLDSTTDRRHAIAINALAATATTNAWTTDHIWKWSARVNGR